MKQLSEKDLFTFVFYPNNLLEEKRILINSNLNKFKVELEFLNDLKNSLNQIVPKSILDRIHEKIDIFESKNGYLLEKINKIKDSEYLVLAADSPNNIPTLKTDTFVDSQNKFMCKVISSNEANKIYLFSSADEEFLEFNITLLPSKESFIVNKKDMPVILSPKQIIDQIKLRIVN